MFFAKLVGNDKAEPDEKTRPWDELCRLFNGTTPENSQGIGQRMMEAMNDGRKSGSDS